MQLSEAWLREWVDPDLDTSALAEQLSMAGLEVDGIVPAAPSFSGVVVGEVIACEQHPNADKLKVCQVAIGTDEPTQIVCGARNVAAGLKVPVALPGARLSPDFKIRKTKLRGVPSLGMICSASELGLAETSPGILPLAADAPVGEDFRVYWSLDDACIDIDLTPDRGDCFSVRGIAREVAAINQMLLSDLEPVDIPAKHTETYPVEIQEQPGCPRYACRILQGIKRQAETPHWIQERLRRSGIAAISPVVDVTNYVMLETGQPLHAFDRDRLNGSLIVRKARAGETLVLLGGNEVALQAGTLLIADQQGPVALAGIMGGAASAVTAETENIVLEAAHFSPLALAGQARRYGLHTEASQRFERGVDPALPVAALQRATELLQDIVGGQPGPIAEHHAQPPLAAPEPIGLRQARIERILGVTIPDEDVVAILRRLAMQVQPVADGWQVTPPSARFDIAIEADLIEELARLYGYANIPARAGIGPMTVNLTAETALDVAQAKQTWVERGYQEVITYSFISHTLAEQMTPEAELMVLQNPVSSAMSVMRASLWPGLLSTMQYNLARQQTRIRLFEQGQTFQRKDGVLQQQNHLAAAICGAVAAEQWGTATRPVDFYDLKGDLEHGLAGVLDINQLEYQTATHPALHPGQSAHIVYQGQRLGWIGVLHPELQTSLDLPKVMLVEIELAAVQPKAKPAYRPVSKYPAMRRDLALLVDAKLSCQQIMQVARQAAAPIVRDITIFDVYTGEGIPADKKSIAVRLTLQDDTATLEETQIEACCTTLVDTLITQLSVILRD